MNIKPTISFLKGSLPLGIFLFGVIKEKNINYEYVCLQVTCITLGQQKVTKFFTLSLSCLCVTPSVSVTHRSTVLISNQKVIQVQEKKTFQHQTKLTFSPFQVLLTTLATFTSVRWKLTLILLALSRCNKNTCLSDILFNDVLLHCTHNCLNAI